MSKESLAKSVFSISELKALFPHMIVNVEDTQTTKETGGFPFALWLWVPIIDYRLYYSKRNEQANCYDCKYNMSPYHLAFVLWIVRRIGCVLPNPVVDVEYS